MSEPEKNPSATDISKDPEDYREQLSSEEFAVCFMGGTERSFTGKYWDHHELGTYDCIACGTALFESGTKFDSGSGWPSFFQPATDQVIRYVVDQSHGMTRTEVQCKGCHAHLGHVFDDGPPPSGNRYCINSASLNFRAAEPSSEG